MATEASQEKLIAALRAELKQTQAQLSDFRRAFEQAPAMIATLRGDDLVFEFANPLYLQVVAPGRDIMGKPMRQALPELEGQGIFEIVEDVYRTGAPYVGEEVLLHLDRHGNGEATPVYFDFVYQPIRDADGHIDGIIAHAVEVTEKVRARQALASENERIEAEVVRRTQELAAQKAFAESIIQNVPAGVAWLDKDWVYRVVNTEYAEGFMKAPRAKFQDVHIFDALPGTEPQIEHLLRGVFETGQPYYATDFPFKFEHEGQEVTSYWDFVYYPSFEEGTREVNGLFILANEVSSRVARERERERLQQERIAALEEGDRLKDQFLSILSHELRTPINAIMGFGSILDDEVVGHLTAEQRRYTGKILASADALLALIDDLLVVSRVQAGRFSIRVDETDFAPIVAQALEALTPDAERKALTITTEIPAQLPPMRADAQRLGQVLTNLVGNAIKFTPAGGTIHIRAWAEGDHLHTEVIDTGPGIPMVHHATIFRRFGQLDTSNTRNYSGTGLGLSIVKAIVEAHGGVVGVRSEEGRGSTFWFALPLSANPSGPEPPPAPA